MIERRFLLYTHTWLWQLAALLLNISIGYKAITIILMWLIDNLSTRSAWDTWMIQSNVRMFILFLCSAVLPIDAAHVEYSKIHAQNVNVGNRFFRKRLKLFGIFFKMSTSPLMIVSTLMGSLTMSIIQGINRFMPSYYMDEEFHVDQVGLIDW